MAIVIDVGVDELAATRFAISPLGETICALLLLGRPDAHRADPILAPWAKWARAEVRRSRLTAPTVWPLLMNGQPSFPEFVAPAPVRAEVDLDEELAVLAATRTAQVRTSLRRVFGSEPNAAATELAARPAATLRRIAAELRIAHDVLVAPHWSRMHATLVADIGHRARLLALGGSERLLTALAPDVHWDRGRLLVDRVGPDRVVTLGARGLVLVPTALAPQTQIKRNSSTQIVLRYRPRGIGALFETPRGAPPAGLTRLIGSPRARVLGLLRAPASTGALAADLNVTPSAISQHLAALRAAGLVATERHGRASLHSLTDAGVTLLDAPPSRAPTAQQKYP